MPPTRNGAWPPALVLAQLRAQMALPGYASSPTLALLYITDHYAAAGRRTSWRT